MKTKRTTVGAAIIAAVTLIANLNPVPAFAGTPSPKIVQPAPAPSAKAVVPVQPPKATPSAKAVVNVQPSAKSVVSVQPPSKTVVYTPSPPRAPAVTPAPAPAPTPATSPVVRPADPVVTQSDFEKALTALTLLAQQGQKRDDEQDARLAKLEQRADQVPCLIEEAVAPVVVRLADVETKVYRLRQDVDAAVVRLADVETKVVRLATDCAPVRLATTAVASSSASAATSTSSPAAQPTIIVVPMPAMNTVSTVPTTISGSSRPVSSCTQTRTSSPSVSTVRLAPSTPRSQPPAPMPMQMPTYAENCRPGILTRLGTWLFGNGNCGVVAPVFQQPQQFLPPQQMMPQGCFAGGGIMPPRGFGWQQPCPQQVQTVFRPRPQQNCFNGGNRCGGGGSSGPNVVVTSNNNNNNANNNNNNMFALLGGMRGR